jgi:hypothetical protein
MKKQAVVNQIQRSAEQVEDRVMDKALAQVPSIVRRELLKIKAQAEQEGTGQGRTAKDIQDMQRQIDTFSAFYKTEIRRIEEHLTDRMNELSKSHDSGLKTTLDNEREKVKLGLNQDLKLEITRQMDIYRKDLLQLRHTQLPKDIAILLNRSLDVHEKNCIVGKCSVDKTVSKIISKPTDDEDELDRNDKILAQISKTPPVGRILNETDKSTYNQTSIANRAGVSYNVATGVLRRFVSAGIISRREVLYGSQPGVAYWQSDSPQKRVPLTAIKPKKLLDIIPEKIDPSQTEMPKEDPHTVYGIVEKFGFAEADKKTATDKVRHSLEYLVREDLVRKKPMALVFLGKGGRLDWAYWRVKL